MVKEEEWEGNGKGNGSERKGSDRILPLNDMIHHQGRPKAPPATPNASQKSSGGQK